MLIMGSFNYIDYHGLMFPKESHNEKSLEYFEKFNLNDDDLIAITYPKSGKVFFLWFVFVFMALGIVKKH